MRKSDSKENQSKLDPPSWIRKYLSRDDLQNIESKITEIERRTSGELVLVIARRSFEFNIHAPAVTLFVLLCFMIFFEKRFINWMDSQFIIPSAALEFGVKLGVAISLLLLSDLLSRLSFVRRIVVSRRILRAQAQARAELEFYRSGIKETKGKTGILLYVSFTDHQAVVLADKAVSEKLPSEIWSNILKEIITGIKQKRTRDGLMKAVEMSGTILAEHFPIRPDDINELENRVLLID